MRLNIIPAANLNAEYKTCIVARMPGIRHPDFFVWWQILQSPQD
jgi:hypothetical protein